MLWEGSYSSCQSSAAQAVLVGISVGVSNLTDRSPASAPILASSLRDAGTRPLATALVIKLEPNSFGSTLMEEAKSCAFWNAALISCRRPPFDPDS